MILVCKRCGQKITAPDEWAGRTVRCKGCNKLMRVPEILPDDHVDLGGLATYEPPAATEGEVASEWVDFHAIGAGSEKKPVETVRICPVCKSRLRVGDPMINVLCSNCGTDVPPSVGPEDKSDPLDAHGHVLPGAHYGYHGTTQGFYDGVLGSIAYPVAAMGSIVAAIAVAIAVILLPVGLMLLMGGAMRAEPVAGEQFEADWAKGMLFGMFLLELLYFVGVAFYAFIDSTRNTAIGADRPPELTWNLLTVGQALLGYVSLVVYYGLILFVMILAGNNGQLVIPYTLDDLGRVLSIPNLVILGLLTVMVPMNLIGLASGKFIDGINPVKAFRSIINTAGHYLLLLFVDMLYLALYALAMISLVGWTGRTILDTMRQGIDQSLASLAIGLVLWGVLIEIGRASCRERV